jgi:spartin
VRTSNYTEAKYPVHSKGILSFGSWSTRMMQSGADAYIRNSTPRAEPVKFSPTTKAGIRKAHNASVKTVNVTKTTVGMINNVSFLHAPT